ncbi:restriction endonuclease subunit S [Clostridium sp. YIM B02500]|uniref:restriction endonuclease subunit S n=1 Tax=Clostridium sp. YIM B02500 TaxID=2910681 RepID=UPI001EEE8390|nr:restriction endonuclease subunit S [Clostridium sp. YIM B02500]
MGELLISSDKRNNAGKYTQDDILAASLGTELVKKHIFFGLRSTEESVKNYRVVDSGDVIYTKSPIKGYPNGIIRTNKGLEGIVPSLYCVYHSIASINSSFIQSYFEDKGRLDGYLNPMVNVGARNNVNITDLGFLEGTICIPQNIDEQNKIVNFFNHLTNLISLHQRKLEHLQDKKKVLSQKMFPKEGEKFPEFRFPGFTDPWEQHLIGDYYYFKNGLNKGKEFFGHGVSIVNFTDVFHNRGINASKLKGKVNLQPSEIANYSVQKGDIFFTRTSETIDEIGYPSVMIDEPNDTVFSGFVLRGRAVEEDPLTIKFKQYVFYTDEFRKEMIKKSSMTTRALTSGTAIKQMEIYFPKDKREQDKIGDYFEKLDKLITINKRKVEHLQQQKKGLLQQMFI